MNDMPTYSGLASESSGRTFDQAPSAPTRRFAAYGGSVLERQLVPAVAEWRDASELLPPPDRIRGQGVEQDAPQVAAMHLGPPAVPSSGLSNSTCAVLIEDAASPRRLCG